MVRLSALLSLLLVAGAATANDWRYGSFDNGAWFEAHVSHASREIAFNCGGASPGGLPLPQTDEPMVTGDYTLHLTLSQPQLGTADFTTIVPPRTDIVLVTEAGGFRLPRADFDLLDLSGWIQPLAIGDALIAETLRTAALAVDAGGARLAQYDATGLNEALTRLIAFCDARWAATGVALPASAVPLINDIRTQRVDIAPTLAERAPQAAPPAAGTAQAQRRDNGLWTAAQSYILRSCEGGVRQYGEGYAHAANVDGDGVEDYVIWWNEITCAGQMQRPYCGASQCAVDVFVSSVYQPGTRPATIYAAAVDVVPGPEGRDLLQLAGRLANCQQPDAPPDCLFLWGWVNGGLRRVN